MRTLHILSSPYSPVHDGNRIDPFSIAVYKFIKNIAIYGWKCIHYGIAGCQVDCETVICLDYISSNREDNIREYNNTAAVEIFKRKQPGDLILCFYGDENKGAAQYNSDLYIIEPHIGYSPHAVFAPFRVFASYSQMHYYYGINGNLMNPSWFDAVIHNAISASEFEYKETKEDYFLFFGRVVPEKGIHIAIQSTGCLGKKLYIAGPGNLESLGYDHKPSHVEFIGPCNIVQRKILMANAKAIIAPTLYIEPFGNMIAEGYMSGTPAITSDWGGFVDNVQNGVTGYRCKEFRDFVHAIQNIDKIDPKNCRKWAMENCEDAVVHKQFNDYFHKVITSDFYR